MSGGVRFGCLVAAGLLAALALATAPSARAETPPAKKDGAIPWDCLTQVLLDSHGRTAAYFVEGLAELLGGGSGDEAEEEEAPPGPATGLPAIKLNVDLKELQAETPAAPRHQLTIGFSVNAPEGSGRREKLPVMPQEEKSGRGELGVEESEGDDAKPMGPLQDLLFRTEPVRAPVLPPLPTGERGERVILVVPVPVAAGDGEEPEEHAARLLRRRQARVLYEEADRSCAAGDLDRAAYFAAQVRHLAPESRWAQLAEELQAAVEADEDEGPGSGAGDTLLTARRPARRIQQGQAGLAAVREASVQRPGTRRQLRAWAVYREAERCREAGETQAAWALYESLRCTDPAGGPAGLATRRLEGMLSHKLNSWLAAAGKKKRTGEPRGDEECQEEGRDNARTSCSAPREQPAALATEALVREDGTRTDGPALVDVVRERLRTPVTMQYAAAPLDVVFQDVQARYGVPVRVDRAALEQAGVGLDRRVFVTLEGLPLEAALGIVLTPLNLGFRVQGDHIEVGPGSGP